MIINNQFILTCDPGLLQSYQKPLCPREKESRNLCRCGLWGSWWIEWEKGDHCTVPMRGRDKNVPRSGTARKNINTVGKKSLHALDQEECQQEVGTKCVIVCFATCPNKFINPNSSMARPKRGHFNKTSAMPPKKQMLGLMLLRWQKKDRAFVAPKMRVIPITKKICSHQFD